MNIIDIIASMDNFSRIPLKSVNFHYKSAHQVRPVHHSVLHLFPLRRLPRFQLLSWLPAACLEASMAKIWNFIPTVDIQISRHWLACSKELSLVLPKNLTMTNIMNPSFIYPWYVAWMITSYSCWVTRHILVIGAMAGHASSRRSDALSLVKVRHARCLTWSG